MVRAIVDPLTWKDEAVEIFEIAVRRQAKESQDAIELRARIGSRESVEDVINGLDAIIYTHLGVRAPVAQSPTADDSVAMKAYTAAQTESGLFKLAEESAQRETVAEVGTPEQQQAAIDATERAMQDLPPLPVKAKRKYTRKESAPALPVMQEMVVELPLAAEDFAVMEAGPVTTGYEIISQTDVTVEEIDLTPAPVAAPAIDFDLLSLDVEPAPQPAVVNVAKLKVPEVQYKEIPSDRTRSEPVVTPLVPAVTVSNGGDSATLDVPEIKDALKLQKRIQDAIASRVIGPEPVLSLMHDRGFNSTRETDEACRIAILELIIAAEAKK